MKTALYTAREGVHAFSFYKTFISDKGGEIRPNPLKRLQIMTNLFYFKRICKIGGTEQFLYEIAKKYHEYDIVVLYDIADSFQLSRLKKLVKCQKRVKGEKIKCKRAFFNFNVDAIEDIEAERYFFISHANYEELGCKPPIDNPKITDFIGVSQFATDKLNEYSEKLRRGITAKKCYNPLTLEPKEKLIRLVSAGRLDDVVKGGARTLKLIDALDNYCERTGRHYIFTIFTNPTNFVNTLSPNVCIMKPRVDVRPYIQDADYVIQLSNDMETYCYTINEALSYGVPIVTTPLSILKELPITDNEHIVLEWNCENVNEVARQIFEKKVKSFKYTPPKDEWGKLIIKEKSKYEEERKMKFKVRATDKYTRTDTSDNELSKQASLKEGKDIRVVPEKGLEWIVESDRKDVLLDNGFVEVVEVVEDKPTKVESKKKKAKK